MESKTLWGGVKNDPDTKVVTADSSEALESTPEPTSQPTPEPTSVPTPEPTPIVYEGIDMESDLPGQEWVLTFNGIIDEPKLVVLNDSTNKKVIVEEGQEVEFSRDDDELAIYIPNQPVCTMEWEKGNATEVFNSRMIYDNGILYMKTVSGQHKNKKRMLIESVVKAYTANGEEEITLTAMLRFVD